jgi:hypothetical protein
MLDDGGRTSMGKRRGSHGSESEEAVISRPQWARVAGRAATARAGTSVSTYRHDTQREEHRTWSLAETVAALRRRRPQRAADPDWTFCIGAGREYLAISTDGPRAFVGQHPLWGEGDVFEGAMIFAPLSLRQVVEVLEKFHAGRRAEGCFAAYHGRFEFYRAPAPH